MLYYSRNNDLYPLLPGECVSSTDEAMKRAQKGEAIFWMADAYPSRAVGPSSIWSKEQLRQLDSMGCRLYVEYPISVGDDSFEAPRHLDYHRVVVSSDFFSGLSQGQILMQHAQWICTPKDLAVKPLLCSARVAGYRHAVFGLPPEEECQPLLFIHPDFPNVLVATTGLSRFVQGRFAPVSDWRLLWQGILAWMTGDAVAFSEWQPEVRPTYDRQEPLPDTAETTALERVTSWMRRNMIGQEMRVFEGYSSDVRQNGEQPLCSRARGDCTGEILPILAYAGKRKDDPEMVALCQGIMKKLFTSPELCCLDPANPCYGGLKFFEFVDIYYGDDNCRSAMSALLAAQWIQEPKWNRSILRCLFSILRTTNEEGFRDSNLGWPESFGEGKNWDYYGHAKVQNLRPHSQAWMWAGYILAWRACGHGEFLQKAKSGIRMLMGCFPERITWTNGLAQEIARMLLPTAMLVEAEDNAENRSLLQQVWLAASPLLEECGAMRECIGQPQYAMYPPPKSNAEYGTSEAPLIQENGTPCCDLLYTMNFAFLGLHETAVATGETCFRQAEDRMADFLCRIQSHSPNHPTLDGAWIRGFDYQLWEYWGSSADIGWAAWCLESGWTNSWIGVALALRQERLSLFQAIPEGCLSDELPEVLAEMAVVHPLPDTTQNTMRVALPGCE